jgi:ABC-2 type transport system permease protein
MNNINAVLTIAYRDFTKLLRDRFRLVASLVFPFMFVAVLGGSFQANLSQDVGFGFLAFVFTGVIGQTMFQSTASGIISLIEDRQSDFSQEIFVAPVSRYSIIFGKILGESMVAMVQLLGVLLMGVLMGVAINWMQLSLMILASVAACLMGGAFGVLVMANLSSQRSANQVFPFLIFPQFFLAGVFAPVKSLPPVLLVLSRLSPMTYAVDLVRGAYYLGMAESSKTVLFPWWIDLAVITLVFVVFLTIGTFIFVRNEREA